MSEITGIVSPEIRVFKNDDEITILHKEPNKTWEESNSLLTFTPPWDCLDYEIKNATNHAIKDLDWCYDFNTVFKTVKYRKAILNVPLFLLSSLTEE